jgi:hypothetical protein
MSILTTVLLILILGVAALFLIAFIKQESWIRNYRPGDPRPLDMNGKPIGELPQVEADVST